MTWIEEQIKEISDLNEKFISGFSGLDAEKMDWKPGPEIWSINECLDHIIQSNRKYFDMLDAVESGTYKGGLWTHLPVLPRLFGKLVLRGVSPDYKRKTKTSAVFYPLNSKYERNLTAELVEENKILANLFRRCKEEYLDKIIVASPVSNFITYSMRDCIRILVAHEKRHYNQAMNVKLKTETTVTKE